MLLNTGIPSIGQPAAVGLRGSHWGEEYRRRPTSVTSFASVVFGGMTLGPFGPYGRCNPFGPVTDPAGMMNSVSEKYGPQLPAPRMALISRQVSACPKLMSGVPTGLCACEPTYRTCKFMPLV